MRKVIYAELKSWSDEIGNIVRMYTPVGHYTSKRLKDGDESTGKVVFSGTTIVNVGVNGKKDVLEPRPFTFQFPETTKTVQEAWDSFEQVSEAALKEQKEEYQKRLQEEIAKRAKEEKERVMPATATGGSHGIIIGPDGKPFIGPDGKPLCVR